jgi:hypothetical protein
MPFKPNYRMQRADRDRAKELKKREKLLRRTEASNQRKAERDRVADSSDEAPAASDRSPETT